MPVIDNRGKPIDTDHPFANPCVVFGAKRPDSSAKPSTATNAASDSSSPDWTDEEVKSQVSLGKSIDDRLASIGKGAWPSQAPTSPEDADT